MGLSAAAWAGPTASGAGGGSADRPPVGNGRVGVDGPGGRVTGPAEPMATAGGGAPGDGREPTGGVSGGAVVAAGLGARSDGGGLVGVVPPTAWPSSVRGGASGSAATRGADRFDSSFSDVLAAHWRLKRSASVAGVDADDDPDGLAGAPSSAGGGRRHRKRRRVSLPSTPGGTRGAGRGAAPVVDGPPSDGWGDGWGGAASDSSSASWSTAYGSDDGRQAHKVGADLGRGGGGSGVESACELGGRARGRPARRVRRCARWPSPSPLPLPPPPPAEAVPQPRWWVVVDPPAPALAASPSAAEPAATATAVGASATTATAVAAGAVATVAAAPPVGSGDVSHPMSAQARECRAGRLRLRKRRRSPSPGGWSHWEVGRRPKRRSRT
ncbi:hypothetical protein BU14_0116s0031 [Porphyra umbilicalis]|uniref:Uncharacterized protein n=1 Tax=Porphyra umbilicalis TaxID=2786 RepID=A0A1X6PBE4_PORUM|nr:hypothetical protein BU14_0116s0031 [Porphyra umbilicalis]|eukprot:OSX78211.1 hypothetical protein BU14_0116s0031 [Porphyra umbilicalis]